MIMSGIVHSLLGSLHCVKPRLLSVIPSVLGIQQLPRLPHPRWPLLAAHSALLRLFSMALHASRTITTW